MDESAPEPHGGRVPVPSNSHASSSHDTSSEPMRRVVTGNHRIYTHFPKDRNCEIGQRTKITRAPCRRRIGGVVPRAENVGDLITADHKVLRDESESRHSHRYAIVVQDLATQWIQSYPCTTKTSQESTVSTVTSRNTEIVTSASGQKITRASCRRRTGTVVPKAENFGDAITADHRVLSEGCESRHNHRYAVVVKDLATQWLQSYP